MESPRHLANDSGARARSEMTADAAGNAGPVREGDLEVEKGARGGQAGGRGAVLSPFDGTAEATGPKHAVAAFRYYGPGSIVRLSPSFATSNPLLDRGLPSLSSNVIVKPS
jgi:hypothetical protein